MPWVRKYSRKRDMQVKVIDKKTNEEIKFEGKNCSFLKSHIPGAKEVRETITCESVNLQDGLEKESKENEPQGCKTSISLDSEGKPTIKKFNCSEWAIKILTDRDVLTENNLQPSEFGLENLPEILNPPCSLFAENPDAIFKEQNIILRIVPPDQTYRHSIILRAIKPENNLAIIEDEQGIREINLSLLKQYWSKTNYLYAKCHQETRSQKLKK